MSGELVDTSENTPTQDEVRLCTQCWTVDPCDHFPVEVEQSRDPERYQPYHLCVLCARTWAPLRSRWSWLACEACVSVNKQIKQQYGPNVRLPLGRHSIMNGFGVNLSETDQAIQDQQTENLVRATRSWQELFQWGRDEATRIQQTEMPRAYRQASQIPVTIWEERAQPTFDASCRAWLGFAQLASFEDLYESVKYLYEIGEVPEPETPPYPHWKPQPHTG